MNVTPCRPGLNHPGEQQHRRCVRRNPSRPVMVEGTNPAQMRISGSRGGRFVSRVE